MKKKYEFFLKVLKILFLLGISLKLFKIMRFMRKKEMKH